MSTSSPITKRIFQARKAKGISQRELGICIGMEPSSASSRMNHYEKGRHTPDYQTLKRIAEHLGVPVAYFYCESDATAHLLCLIEKLNNDDKELLIRHAEELLGQETNNEPN